MKSDILFLPDPNTCDCYMRESGIRELLEISNEEWSIASSGVPYEYVDAQGRFLQSGNELGFEKAYNFENIRKIADKANRSIDADLKTAYDEAKYNSYFS